MPKVKRAVPSAASGEGWQISLNLVGANMVQDGLLPSGVLSQEAFQAYWRLNAEPWVARAEAAAEASFIDLGHVNPFFGEQVRTLRAALAATPPLRDP